MISLRHSNLIFFLCLTLSTICAGCMFKSTKNDNTAATAKPPVEEPVAYPGEVYEAGDAAYPGGYYIHTVKLSDESLSIIAKWFTGDLMNWQVLAQCNPDINPNRIFLGNKIRIPRDLMTRHTAMTSEFVEESQPQLQQKKEETPANVETTPVETEVEVSAGEPTPEPETEPEPDDEPLLFGPKGYSTD